MIVLAKNEFMERFGCGVHLLDGGTGTSLLAAGMPRGTCTEEWILYNPEPLVALQRGYAGAGSEIIYAPTFRAQPAALARFGLDGITENINEMLVALSRRAAPGCLVAGNMTTLKGCIDSEDVKNYSALVGNYRRQIRGLIDGGADLLAAETLLYTTEALAILEAAAIEGAGMVMCSFTMRADGQLYDGSDGASALKEVSSAGAAAVGINCIAADDGLPGLVEKLKKDLDVPFICKPNAGRPVTDEAGKKRYPVDGHRFARLMARCVEAGAGLVGGCCGTDPDYIRLIAGELGL